VATTVIPLRRECTDTPGFKADNYEPAGSSLSSIVRPIREYQDKRSRDFVLRNFPKNSVGAEIGVWKGDFSQEILGIVKPRKLHLIDPWAYQDSVEFSRALYGRELTLKNFIWSRPMN